MKNIIIVLLLIAVGILITMPGQLKYPLDGQSKKIIEKAVDEFIDQKVHSLIWKRTFHYVTFFESLDGFGTAGAVVTLDKDDLLLTTGGTENDAAYVVKTPAWQGMVTFSQKSYWRSSIVISSIANATTYFVVGALSAGSYYGFKVVDDSLKGVSFDGTTEKTVDLKTIEAATAYNIEARYLPSDKIVFFVNSVETGVISANLPSPAITTNVNLFELKIVTNEAAAKTIQLSFFEYLQSRNVLR